jgi:hypothetical protein
VTPDTEVNRSLGSVRGDYPGRAGHGHASWRRVRHQAFPDVSGQLGGLCWTVPIAATFPVKQIRDAVEVQASRHVHGKIVITL